MSSWKNGKKAKDHDQCPNRSNHKVLAFFLFFLFMKAKTVNKLWLYSLNNLDNDNDYGWLTSTILSLFSFVSHFLTWVSALTPDLVSSTTEEVDGFFSDIVSGLDMRFLVVPDIFKCFSMDANGIMLSYWYLLTKRRVVGIALIQQTEFATGLNTWRRKKQRFQNFLNKESMYVLQVSGFFAGRLQKYIGLNSVSSTRFFTWRVPAILLGNITRCPWRTCFSISSFLADDSLHHSHDTQSHHHKKSNLLIF